MSIFCSKSDLFNTMIVVFFNLSVNCVDISPCEGETLRPLIEGKRATCGEGVTTLFVDPSRTYRQISLSLIEFLASSTPIASITFSVSRNPAVSEILTGRPLIKIFSLIMSLVVPGMSVTIARSVPKIAFSSDDFPTFGEPAIVILIPLFNKNPAEHCEIKFLSFDIMMSISFSIFESSIKFSCSGKSKSISRLD